MLLLLAAVYALQQVFASPIPGPGSITERRSLPSCTDPTDCRTIWNILWSCVVTIFACTWVAVHPNIPKPGEDLEVHWYSRPLRRARIMFFAIIGPEFLILWAWRQRMVANRKPQNPEALPDWSSVHGFFAAMGGFVDGERVLSLEDIEVLVERDEIEYPIASRDEINDRSKGDAVTKALVVFQTSWFLLQCIARGSQHLALTELELTTAAFALLNAITYAIWWDKPLNVQCPIKVRRTRAQQEEEEEPEVVPRAYWTAPPKDSFWRKAFGPLRGVGTSFVAMMDMHTSKDHDAFFVVGERWDDMGQTSVLGAIFMALLFGGIHCIAWSFAFPSHIERLLWRISSLAITAVPLAFTFTGLINAAYFDNSLPWSTHLPLLLLYVFSRLNLLVLSLTTLRSLPLSALQTVRWTTFLPHGQ